MLPSADPVRRNRVVVRSPSSADNTCLHMYRAKRPPLPSSVNAARIAFAGTVNADSPIHRLIMALAVSVSARVDLPVGARPAIVVRRCLHAPTMNPSASRTRAPKLPVSTRLSESLYIQTGMGTQRKTFVIDYERGGERLVAICTGCQRTAVLMYSELNRRAKHMCTLEELARSLRCRKCRKKVAIVRLARSFSRPPATRH
jgi:hypothetical protein